MYTRRICLWYISRCCLVISYVSILYYYADYVPMGSVIFQMGVYLLSVLVESLECHTYIHIYEWRKYYIYKQ